MFLVGRRDRQRVQRSTMQVPKTVPPRRALLPPKSGRSARVDKARRERMPHPLIDGPLWIATRILLPIVMLAVLGAGVGYVRLLNGPISLKSLAEPIARSIGAELPGMRVSVEDAIITLSEAGGLELRLQNVRFAEAEGTPVAVAPLAALRINMAALWKGKIVPQRIVLIEPQLRLSRGRDGGLAISMSQRGAAGRPTGQRGEAPISQTSSAPAPKGEISTSDEGKAIDLASTIAAITRQSRQLGSTASYLKGIGLRDATLVVDNGDQKSQLRIAEAEFGMNYGRHSSVLAGDISFASSRGRWRMSFVAEDIDGASGLAVKATLHDLVPRDAIEGNGDLGFLAALDAPVSATTAIGLSRSGMIETATVDLSIGKGMLRPGWPGAGLTPIDAGRFELAYSSATRRIELKPSRISSGQSWATFAGRVDVADGPGASWPFEIAATEGVIAAEDLLIGATPLELLAFRGRFSPAIGGIDLDDGRLRVAGNEFQLRGQAGAARLAMRGQLSAMSLEAVKVMWPAVLAPGARRWIGQQVTQGHLASGSFTIDEVPPGAARGSGPGFRFAATFEAGNVRVLPKPGLPPVEAAKALIRIDGNALEITVPEAMVLTSPQRRLPLRSVRMVSADVARRAQQPISRSRRWGRCRPHWSSSSRLLPGRVDEALPYRARTSTVGSRRRCASRCRWARCSGPMTSGWKARAGSWMGGPRRCSATSTFRAQRSASSWRSTLSTPRASY